MKILRVWHSSKVRKYAQAPGYLHYMHPNGLHLHLLVYILYVQVYTYKYKRVRGITLLERPLAEVNLVAAHLLSNVE